MCEDRSTKGKAEGSKALVARMLLSLKKMIYLWPWKDEEKFEKKLRKNTEHLSLFLFLINFIVTIWACHMLKKKCLPKFILIFVCTYYVEMEIDAFQILSRPSVVLLSLFEKIYYVHSSHFTCSYPKWYVQSVFFCPLSNK